MCQFDTPIYVYYSHIAVFVLCLLTAILILIRNPKEASNRNAFYFIFILALWVADVFGQWTIKDAFWNKFFVQLSLMSDLTYLFFVYFAYYLTRTKITFKQKILFAIPYIILPFLAFSKYNLAVFNPENCDYSHSLFIGLYLYFFEIFYASWATYILIKKCNNFNCNILVPFQIKILIPAIWFFAIWNILSEEIYRISFSLGSYIDNTPHFIIGNLFFVSLIAFAIIRKELFEFPIVITNHYTVVVWTLIFLGFIFFYSNLTLIVLAAIFCAVLMYIFWKM